MTLDVAKRLLVLYNDDINRITIEYKSFFIKENVKFMFHQKVKVFNKLDCLTLGLSFSVRAFSVNKAPS